MNLMRFLRQSWAAASDLISLAIAPAQLPSRAYGWFSKAEVAAYDASMSEHESEERVDDATWADLELEAYLRHIASHCSIVGRQYLYRSLRVGGTEGAKKRLRAAAVSGDAGNLLLSSGPVLQQLRTLTSDPCELLFADGQLRVSERLRLFKFAPLLLLVAAALLGWQRPGAAALWGLMYFAVFAFGMQICSASLRRWRAQRDEMLLMLRAAGALAGLGGSAESDSLMNALQGQRPEIQRLLRNLAPSRFEAMPALQDQRNWLTCQEFWSLPARVAVLTRSLADIRPIYRALAECEAQLVLLAHLQHGTQYCWPQLSTARQFRLVDMVHPLLPAALPLSLSLEGRGLLISGKNGSGKSTVLRGLGLNVMVARAFGFCYAGEAALPNLPVWSSLQTEDSLDRGESLYMAEMRRAETLLKIADKQPALFLIDELFRGTNPIESIAAASAVIQELAQSAVVVASSHHQELANNLRRDLEPMHLSRDSMGLRMEPGVLLESNGIAMMNRYAIPQRVKDRAREFVAELQHLLPVQSMARQAPCSRAPRVIES